MLLSKRWLCGVQGRRSLSGTQQAPGLTPASGYAQRAEFAALVGGRPGALRPYLPLGLGLGLALEVGSCGCGVGPQSRPGAQDALPRRQAPGECPPWGKGLRGR